ncbi:MAG: cupin domain-containing protein [Thermomicrobiales bacterium]|nr:cupin domain-containing protein [Thermomicrobiales bacterium]
MSSESATVSIPFIQSIGDAKEGWFFGGRTRIRATANDTNGQLSVIEQVGDPGTGSPYHVHRDDDEQFYILEGEVRFVSGDQSWIGGPGTFAFLPRDVPHGFEVVGSSAARYVLMTTPGGFDSFVAEFSTDQPGPPDLPKVMEAAARYGLEILGPLPE